VALSGVSNFVALPSTASVYLSWTTPSDPSYASVLLLRSTAPIVDLPVAGTAYVTGSSLGAATVVVSADTNSFLDQGLTNGTLYYYEVFASSATHQYSAGVGDSATPDPVLPSVTDVALPISPSTVQVDATGGYHVLGGDSTGSTAYASCTSGCTTASNWSQVAIAQQGGQMALDAQGAPRVALGTAGGGVTYRACAAGCNVEANWSSVAVPNAGGDGPVGIVVDSGGAVWIAGQRLNSTTALATLSRCAAGCSSATNWTTIDVPIGGTRAQDLQIGPTGAMAIAYYQVSSGTQNYWYSHLASCTSDCLTPGSWSSTKLTSPGQEVTLLAYRFLPDGKGARSLQSLQGSITDTGIYSSCDACAPSMPPQVVTLSLTSWYPYGLVITSKGEPRAIEEVSSGATELVSCDYQCDRTSNWTLTSIAPISASNIFLAMFPGDRLAIAYTTGSGAGVLRLPN